MLIPESAGMPTVQDARVAHDRLDVVLAARPDITADLARAVNVCAGTETVREVQLALHDDPAAWGALTLACAGAYFLSTDVITLLDYRPPGPRWDVPVLEQEAIELLRSVKKQAPLYRPTSGVTDPLDP